ncbi:MAG: hypothetical protein ACLP1Y_08210 [Candidatus Acidiferrales bacterium]
MPEDAESFLGVKPSPAPSLGAGESGGGQGIPFLYVPVARVILLSIASCGLYEAYWIYKNWWYVKKADGLQIHPFWRGMFGVFFCHSLFRRIHKDAEATAAQEASFSAGGLATGWVILIILANLISRVGGVASIIAYLMPSYLFLVPVQNYVNAATRRRNPAAEYYRWSAGHILCLVLGLAAWAVTLLSIAAESS